MHGTPPQYQVAFRGATGRFGSVKSVKVGDYMARRLVTFSPDTNAFAAMRELLERKISGAPVVDDKGHLIGVLSEVDLMKVVVQGSYHDEMGGLVRDFMHADVETISPDMDIYSLAELFIRDHRRRYPVLEEGRLVGQISRRDVLKAMEDFANRRG